ncbi:hypothetical protein [Pontixanthobacter aquaemixtae]|uniref:Integral membrane protein n=1 Tax=Pontixanthobacter aquaemixtae TaxID=1958940 RepID=A0A844ZUT8_9SPHN|nr:hypothetical protein [Pontixanthobacter aquaemixtae]MXO91753.1 hypothetical protein [Pontixanthobacter aquaemixtae]
MGGIGPGVALLAVAALLVWIVLLVWLAQRILRFIGLRTGWGPLDPRNIGVTFVLLAGAIHLGNYALDWLGGSGVASQDGAVSFPTAFLIGSVAIGVGIAAIRWHRQQKPKD